MGRLALPFALLLQCLACRPPGPASPEPRPDDPLEVVAEAARLAAQDLWPGFSPRTIPVAIYDGDRTMLFHHPSPPAEFAPVAGHDNVQVFAGRHPQVNSNSSVDLGGAKTATVMPSSPGASIRARAALVLHESFHVFQRVHHPTWVANEVELFTYPAEDPGLLTSRRLETEALRRALLARQATERLCWARAAIAFRHQRYAAMTTGAVAYERLNELNEGLATYVERRAAGAADGTTIPAAPWAPEAIRQRTYRSGAALGRLLDDTDPLWRQALTQADTIPLDLLLADAITRRHPGGETCSVPPGDHARITAAAEADAAALRLRVAAERASFLDQPGWRVVIESGDAVLFPQGFDPLNVQVVAPGEVLHRRFVKLGNQHGSIEVLGRASLSVAAGAHPLFNGVRRLTITGLAEAPKVGGTAGVVTLQAEGISAEWRNVSVEHGERQVTIRIAHAPE